MSTNSQRFEKSGAIADGPAIQGLDINLLSHFISILFFTDATQAVIVDKATMTGNVVFELSEDGNEFGTMIDGTLTLGVSQYNRPIASGSYTKARATFNTVVGATHYKMLVSSFAG